MQAILSKFFSRFQNLFPSKSPLAPWKQNLKNTKRIDESASHLQVCTTSDKLKEAARKLEEFSQYTFKKHKTSPLKKTIALVHALLSLSPPTSPNTDEILNAVDTINRGRLTIQKLERGTISEKALAQVLTKAIETYNQSCDRESDDDRLAALASAPPSLSKLFGRSGDKVKKTNFPKIELPKNMTLEYNYTQYHSSENLLHLSHQKNFSAKATAPTSLPKQTAELFQMKVLSLLDKYEIATNPEARELVKNSPILAVPINQKTCTLAQKLTLFPGQVVTISGTVEMDPLFPKLFKLFPETFCLSLKTTQTAFPHASQRNGWSLATSLIAPNPQRVDLLPKLSSFYEKKKKMASDLLPKGKLIRKAKKILRLKREAFEAHKIPLLKMHEELALSIIRAHSPLTEEQKNTIQAFYEELAKTPSAFNILSDTHDRTSSLFITGPYQFLIKSFIKETGEDRLSKANFLFDKTYHNALKKTKKREEMVTSPLEKKKYAYIHLMGEIFGSISKNIILQYLSEDLSFPPPSLSLLEKKMQTLAYHHAKQFWQELELEIPSGLEKEKGLSLLKEQLEFDLNSFNTDILSMEISEEMSHYFNLRY